ncbi:T9SS type A sorting domain-containing protein [Maribacter aquivivus]|uniref:T9SS type A sorting domain-containing protein n=1 Tax=Maribacter aquivivus TaxID=228958 RepID=UPI002492C21B|nr:T9SS type A sorting domain-containing protein [Maribacter aquivivus]
MKNLLKALIVLFPIIIQSQDYVYYLSTMNNEQSTSYYCSRSNPASVAYEQSSISITDINGTIFSTTDVTDEYTVRPSTYVWNGGRCRWLEGPNRNGTFGLGGYSITIPPNVNSYYEYLPIYRGSSLYFERIDLNISYELDCNTTSINASSGVSDNNILEWEYRFNGSDPNVIPNSENLASLAFDFDNFVIDLNANNNSIIDFRYKLVGGNYSPWRPYTIVACSPELDEITNTNVTCYNDTNAEVTIKFKDNIDSTSIMRYYIYEGLPSSFTGDMLANEQPNDIPLITAVDSPTIELNSNLEGTYSGLGVGTYFIIYQELDYSVMPVVAKNGQITESFTVLEPSNIIPSVNIIQAECPTHLANLEFSASGGNEYPGTYTYKYKLNLTDDWTDVTGNDESISTTNSSQNLFYKAVYTYTDDSGSCESDVITINNAIDIAPIFEFETTNTREGQDPSPGGSDGTIEVVLTGGTSAITLEIFNEIGPTLVQSVQLTGNDRNHIFTGLQAGSYYLEATDNNPCPISSPRSYVLEATPIPDVSIPVTSPPSCSGSTDGEVEIALTGTLNPYTYRIRENDENGNIILTDNDNVSPITISNLDAGTYYLEMIFNGTGDFNVPATLGTAFFTIANTNPITIDLVNVVGLDCNGTQNGYIEIEISEPGNYEYSYRFLNDWIALNANGQIPITTSDTYNDIIVRKTPTNPEDNNFCTSDIINDVFVPAGLIVTEINRQNVSTIGGDDGAITIEVDGGTPNTDPNAEYSFNWTGNLTSDGSQVTFNTQNLNNLYPGNYQVVVMDAKNCEASLPQIIEIIDPGPLQIISFTGIDVSCNGANDGLLTINVQGTLPVTYTWYSVDTNNNTTTELSSEENSNNTASLTTGPGTYRVIVQDLTDGPFTSQDIVIQDIPAITATIVTTETCFNSFSGTVIISDVMGGTLDPNPNYSYSIDSEDEYQLTGFFNDVSEANHIIRIREAGGCVYEETITITETEAITLNEAQSIIVNISADGQTLGSISPVFDGGFDDGIGEQFTYVWSGLNVGGSTDKDITNLIAGDYTVTVTDDFGCSLEETFSIVVQDEFTIAPLTGTPTICFDQNNGSITATIEATGLVTFNWRLEDGTAIETILDSDLREITLDNLEDGSYYLEATNENTTITSDIFTIARLPEITATILTTRTCFEGNTGTITFIDPVGSPSGSFLYSIDNGETYEDTPLFEGLPEDTYYPRLSTVENSNCDFITNAVDILASPALFYNEAGTTITRASGPGANDGAISVAVQGGTPPYTYAIDGGTQQDSNVFNDLSEGTYEITITDSVGCVEPASIQVTAIGPLTISNIVPNDALCRNEANGSITTTVTGEEPISYEWTLSDGSPVPVSNGVNTQNINGLLSGDYILTVTDPNTTVTSEVISIGQPIASLSIINIIPTDVSCFGGSDGSIAIQAEGGTGNYTYSINGVDFQPESIFDGLEANIYSVFVRDENLCEFQESTPVGAPIELNIAVTEQIPTSAANAFDGAIYITPEGGSDGYTYLWSGPNDFTSNEQDITNLEAGSYTVIITDANFNINNDVGCQFISDNIIVTEPGQLIATIEQTEFIACSGDATAEIVANVQGGVLPYTYQWYEDNNGNNILLEEETNIIANLPYGTYYLIATDDNDISVESNRIAITQPNLLGITVDNVTNVLCSGETTGAISVTVSGGTPPYQYYWSNGETLPDITGLEAGEYTIEVEDNGGCIAEQSIIIASPNEALEIRESILTNASDYQVNDGSITIEVAGGQEPYTYTWIQSSTNAVISNEATISNLPADTYTVIISDVYDCDLTEIYEITQPDIIEETILQPSCFGNTDGSINLLVNQGNGVFTYQWNSGETTNTLNNLGAGTYTVTVTGLSDGPITRSYTLENPNPIDVNLGIDRVLCADQTLELDATVDDESATYTWTSDNGFTSTSPLVVLNITGNYTVTVETENGCTAQGNIRVDVSNDEIDAEFAMSSQVFVGETAVAVDLSYPLPDGIEWIVPLGAEVVTQNQDEVEFAFAEAGEYEITLITTKGNCIAEQTKKIIVIPTDNLIQEDSSKDGQKVVEEFICYPNPTTGVFSVDVNLTEEGDISIKVFNMVSNTLIASERERGQTNYSVPFDISGLPTGVYAVVLETPYGTSLQKVIVR